MVVYYLFAFLLLPPAAIGFTHPNAFCCRGRLVHFSSSDDNDDDASSAPMVVEATVVNPEVVRLEKELFKIAESTNRGFKTSSVERNRARELIYDLARFNPTLEPASPYYNTTPTDNYDGSPSLVGKWTLVYTDAPDIIGLDSPLPFATTKLGRIGQECDPPLIKNVIEWKRPDWSNSLLFSGTDESRILQKVCTEGTASPDKPFIVTLRLVGIDVVAPTSGGGNATSFGEAIQKDGLLAAWFQKNPLEWRGPVAAPFGQFEILYLDDRMRIIKTGQNYLAVNIRNEEDWF